MAITIVNPHISLYDLKVLLTTNLDSGKLIIVDPEVRQVGKTQALIEVSLENDIPILSRDQTTSRHINMRADKEISYSHIFDIEKFSVNKGFLVDQGVDLRIIESLVSRSRPDKIIRLRTGFFVSQFL